MLYIEMGASLLKTRIWTGRVNSFIKHQPTAAQYRTYGTIILFVQHLKAILSFVKTDQHSGLLSVNAQ